MTEHLTKILHKPMIRGLSGAARHEYQQSIRRFLFALAISAVFFITHQLDPTPGLTHALTLSIGYASLSLLLLLSLVYHKRGSHSRRVLTLLGDQGVTCLAMHSLGEAGTPLVSVLFLITLGYGVRYGARYLLLGTLISSSGLLSLTLFSPFLSSHPLIGASLIVINLSVSLFVSRLLRSRQPPDSPDATILQPPDIPASAPPKDTQAVVAPSPAAEADRHQALIMTESLSQYQKLEKQLKVWDIGCEAISSPQALNQAISAQSPTLILVDLQHLHEPRAQLLISSNLARRTKTPFILLDGRNIPTPPDRLPDHDAFIQDPDDQRALFNVIHHAINRTELPVGVPSLHQRQSLKETKKPCILVADAHSVTRRVLQEALGKSAFEVVVTDTGESAMEAFDTNDIDLAILGRNLPGLDGLEVMREFRMGYGLIRKIPFIILTPQISKAAEAECRSAGADRIHQTPLIIDELLGSVSQLLDASSADRTAKPRGPVQPTRFAAVHPQCVERDTLDMLSRLSEREDFFEELVNNFLDDIHACATRIKRALEANNTEQFRDEVHAIKGAASSIGANHLLNKSIQLYRLTGQEIRQQGERRLDELNQSIEDTRHALEDYIREHNLDIRIRSR
ncbi:MAG: response regulator [Candidatus Thiodiazotropha sp.]